jgi:hypothetical protein
MQEVPLASVFPALFLQESLALVRNLRLVPGLLELVRPELER